MPPTQTQEWFVSADAEGWPCVKSYPSKEAAILGGPAELKIPRTDPYYIGRKFEVRIDAGRYAEYLIRQAAEQAEEQVGDEASSWPGETEVQMLDLRKRLQLCFHGWMKDHGLRPTFFAITEVEQINPPEPKAPETAPAA